ncbi:MAG: hypothetical protein Q7U74_12330 [Saprospiraceae bacterium]|nr:hypothetical protein [Saprospiraceae bacterium]
MEIHDEDKNICLTQKMMATVYNVSVPAISQHLKRIFADNELEETAVIKQYLTTAADGKNYQVKHFSLQAINPTSPRNSGHGQTCSKIRTHRSPKPKSLSPITIKPLASLADAQCEPLWDRLDAVCSTCHTFDYGAGDDIDDLLAE